MWTYEQNPKKPEEIVDNLDPTEDGEACEQAHSSSNQTQLGFNIHLQKFNHV